MNRQEANIILNQVREGIMHPLATVIKALTITGDIHDKCSSPYNIPSNRLSPNDSPFAHPAGLQVLEGEPK